MLVTDKFVFVHLPRCGGTFVSDVVNKFFPSVREIGYHLPRTVLPAEFSHLPVLGTVRNPWAFYPSWYYHHYPNKKHLALFALLSGNRTLGFADTARNALNLGVNDRMLDALIPELPDEFNYRDRHVANLTRDVMRTLHGSGLGLFSFRLRQLFGPADDVHFCRLESLRADLIAFFERIGAATDALREYVLGQENKNTSEHGHYSTYYTPELAELVSIRERPVIERFGYVFEQPAEMRVP
jgi:hypothetical protein